LRLISFILSYSRVILGYGRIEKPMNEPTKEPRASKNITSTISPEDESIEIVSG